MNTTWADRRRIEETVAQGGRLTVEECRFLIQDADEGERAMEQFEAIKKAIEHELHYAVIDVTTDDDNETVLNLVPIATEPKPLA